MKRVLLLIVFSLTCMVLWAQNEKEAKTGWNFGALPTITYNTDLGFQYGALIDLYHYGDGSQYPDYKHNIYMEASQFTKGSAIYRIAYDSKYLIPGIRISSDLAYLPDYAWDFYGFNGYESVYNPTWHNDANEDGNYKSRMFYKYQNHQFRFKTDVQIPLNDKFLAIAGISLQKFSVSRINIDKFNKGKDNDDPSLLPDVPTLFDHYVDWGVISSDEADGGFVPTLKVGAVFDTRDNEPNPMKGMWTEAFLYGSPEFLGAESGFLKVHLTHRQYFTLIKNDLSFAYRLSYQGTLSGETPFYYLSQVETSKPKGQTGVGGSSTIRGINRNSVLGEGIFYGNTELRWKAVHFNFINQNFYIGLNGFLDFGQVVQKRKIDASSLVISSAINSSTYFDFEGKEQLHIGYGGGLRIVMNQNFIVAVDYGMAMKEQDGSSALYIGLNYLF